MTGTHALILLFPRSVVPSLICYLALRLGGRWPAFGVCWRLADRFLGFSVSLCAWVVDGQRLVFAGVWPIDRFFVSLSRFVSMDTVFRLGATWLFDDDEERL